MEFPEEAGGELLAEPGEAGPNLLGPGGRGVDGTGNASPPVHAPVASAVMA